MTAVGGFERDPFEAGAERWGEKNQEKAMGLFDWLLTDPTQGDGGFLARLLFDQKPGASNAASAAPAASSALTAGNSVLLGESPLVNLLRSGFAGMNAANGYTGFGPQFAAGVKGGTDAIALRRQQMIDQINALKLNQALAAKVGMPGAAGDGVAPDGSDASLDGSGAGTANDGSANKPCPTCAGANTIADPQAMTGASPHFPVIVRSPDEAAKLAPGTWFRTPDGRVMQRGMTQVFNNG
jgi:hypothetical protein